MKTIVLDDDPTGTQSATGVTVLLESDADLLTDALRHADSVYVQTNSRALDEATAVALIRRIRADGAGGRCPPRRRGPLRAAWRLDAAGPRLRRDRGLPRRRRGHAVRAGVPRRRSHHARRRAPTCASTVSTCQPTRASTPTTPCSGSPPASWSTTSRRSRAGSAVPVPLATVRGDAAALAARSPTRRPGAVIAPDAVDADDIAAIARAVDAATAAGSDGRRAVRRAARRGARRRHEPVAAADAAGRRAAARSCSCAVRTPRARPRSSSRWSRRGVPRPSSTRMPRCANPTPPAWRPPRRRVPTSRPARSRS